MSSLKRATSPEIVQTEIEELDKKNEVEVEYKPQHPLMEFIQNKQEAPKKVDHLESYVEVDPFADKN